jgi:hypothetical protein
LLSLSTTGVLVLVAILMLEWAVWTVWAATLGSSVAAKFAQLSMILFDSALSAGEKGHEN